MVLYSNGVYMTVFAGSAIFRIKGSAFAGSQTQLPPSSPTPRQSADSCLAAHGVIHWVIIPQYMESVDVVAMTLRSICQSPIARTSIFIVLAMEQRDSEANVKAEQLRREFACEFAGIQESYHPKNLPNDPPGKASNLAWAFKELVGHLRRADLKMDNVMLTIADADSEFSPGYFETLGTTFASTSEAVRYARIWQSPVFHIKNYHRQPGPVTVGTLFTAISELAFLSDPNAW